MGDRKAMGDVGARGVFRVKRGALVGTWAHMGVYMSAFAIHQDGVLKAVCVESFTTPVIFGCFPKIPQ